MQGKTGRKSSKKVTLHHLTVILREDQRESLSALFKVFTYRRPRS